MANGRSHFTDQRFHELLFWTTERNTQWTSYLSECSDVLLDFLFLCLRLIKSSSQVFVKRRYFTNNFFQLDDQFDVLFSVPRKTSKSFCITLLWYLPQELIFDNTFLVLPRLPLAPQQVISQYFLRKSINWGLNCPSVISSQQSLE